MANDRWFINCKLRHIFGKAVDLLLAVYMLVQEVADILFHFVSFWNHSIHLYVHFLVKKGLSGGQLGKRRPKAPFIGPIGSWGPLGLQAIRRSKEGDHRAPEPSRTLKVIVSW